MENQETLRDVLGSVVGKISGKGAEHGKAMFDAVLKETQENLARLESCSLHDFASQPIGCPPTRWYCTKCGGYVNAGGKHWYGKGILHESLRSL